MNEKKSNDARIPMITLDNNSHQTISRFFLHRKLSPYQDFDDFSSISIQCLSFLPQTLIKTINQFRTMPTYAGALLLKNLPIDLELPNIPDESRLNEKKKSFVSEGILVSISQLLGDIFSYSSEKNGELIHNIYPIKAKENQRSNAGSLNDFLLHTELAYFEHKPDYLILLCLRSHHEKNSGHTTLAFIKDAIGKLDQKDLELLRQPIFEIGIPESFNKKNTRILSKVIFGPEDNPQSCINLNDMSCQSNEGQQALMHLQEHLESEEVCLKVFLNPGEMLIIDNRKTVHGRTSFKANHDGNDRWLQRVYVKSNLWDSRQLIKSSSRVLEMA